MLRRTLRLWVPPRVLGPRGVPNTASHTAGTTKEVISPLLAPATLDVSTACGDSTRPAVKQRRPPRALKLRAHAVHGAATPTRTGNAHRSIGGVDVNDLAVHLAKDEALKRQVAAFVVAHFVAHLKVAVERGDSVLMPSALDAEPWVAVALGSLSRIEADAIRGELVAGLRAVFASVAKVNHIHVCGNVAFDPKWKPSPSPSSRKPPPALPPLSIHDWIATAVLRLRPVDDQCCVRYTESAASPWSLTFVLVNRGGNPHPATSVCAAARANHVKCLEVLHAAGAGCFAMPLGYWGARTSALQEALSRGHAEALAFMLRHTDVTAATLDNAELLCAAARHGDPTCLKQLIAAAVELKVRVRSTLTGMRSGGARAVAAAAELGHLECIRVLVAAGATPDAQAAVSAATHGFVEVLRLLHSMGVSLSTPDATSHTPAAAAAANGQSDCLEALAALGVDVQQVAVDADGTVRSWENTPAGLAVANGKLACLEVLHKLGVKLNARPRDGIPLAHYVFQGWRVHFECLEFLITTVGCDVNATKTSHGSTLLLAVAELCHEQGMRLLCGAGAYLCATNLRGQSAAHMLGFRRHEAMAGCLRVLLAAATTIEHLSLRDDTGATPAHVAARWDSSCLRLLRDVGVDLSVEDKQGVTPAHVAVLSNNESCLHVLRDAGVDLSVKDKKGLTPVHLAVQHNHATCLQVLRDAGVDLRVVDKRGRTLAHFLAFCSHQATDFADCVNLLKDAGVDLQAKNRRGETPLDVLGRALKSSRLPYEHKQCYDVLVRAAEEQKAQRNAATQTTCLDALRARIAQTSDQP